MRRPTVALALVLAGVLGLQAGAGAQGMTCADFADQQGAQLSLPTNPGLDEDGDGQACEDYFAAPPSVNSPPSTTTDVSTDDSGGTDVDDTSGASGQTVTVPEPALSSVETSVVVDGGELTEGGAAK